MIRRAFTSRRSKVLSTAVGAVGSLVAFNQLRDRFFWWKDDQIAETGSTRFFSIRGLATEQSANLTARERYILMGRLRERANRDDTMAIHALLSENRGVSVE